MAACCVLAPLFGCASDVVIAVLPSDARSAVIIAEREAWAVEGAPLSIPAGEAEALFYGADLSSLALAPGALTIAVADADPDEVWRLPTPIGGARFDAEGSTPLGPEAIDAVIDATVVARPSCGGLRIDSTVALPGTDAVYGHTVAVAGAHALVTTTTRTVEAGRFEPPRAFVVSEGGPIPLAVTTATGSALFAIASEGTLYLVELGPSATRIHAVDAARASAVLVASAATSPGDFDDVAMWPGASAIYARSGRLRALMRFDLETEAWSLVHQHQDSVPLRCVFDTGHQLLQLHGPDRGVVGFAQAPPLRFGPGGVAPLAPELELGRPCITGYGRFASGAEVLFAAAGATGAVTAGWRHGPDDAWRSASWPTRSHGAVEGDTRLVVLQGVQGGMALLDLEARRPELPPRVCARIELGSGERLARDGDRVVALTKPLLAPVHLARVSITAP